MWEQLAQLTQGAGQNVQIVLFLLLIGLVLVFIKMNSYERRIKNLEDSLRKYITYDDYMESFNNMFAAAERGESVSPFAETDALPPQTSLSTRSDQVE